MSDLVTGLRPRSRTILLAGLVGGAAVTSGIALTATSGWLIVRASQRPVILTLLVAIVAVRAFGIARPVFRYVERVWSHDAALGDLARRRREAYQGLIPLTPARLGRRARSHVLTGVVDDLSDVVEAQVRVAVPVITGVVAGTAAAALVSALQPFVGLVVAAQLLTIAAASRLALRLERGSLPQLLSARAELARVSTLVAQQAGELQAIGAEQAALGWLADAQRVERRAVSRQSRGRALVAAVVLLSTGMASVAAAALAVAADVSAPVAALLVVVPVAVGEAMAPLTETMRALARAEGGAARLRALLEQEPAVTGAGRRQPDTRAPELVLRGVSASWSGGRIDLLPIDLDLPPGRRIAVVGANGSGKSTLLAVLARQLDPVAGDYRISGVTAHDLDLATARALMAVVDDEPHVFAGTVRANLLLARPDATDDDVRAALAEAGLRSWLAGLPQALDTPLGTGHRGVSGGERARLGLARALLSGRPVVLLDEPVAQLDHATATAVLHDLMVATRGRTVVMVTHRPEGLDAFDAVLELSVATGVG